MVSFAQPRYTQPPVLVGWAPVDVAVVAVALAETEMEPDTVVWVVDDPADDEEFVKLLVVECDVG